MSTGEVLTGVGDTRDCNDNGGACGCAAKGFGGVTGAGAGGPNGLGTWFMRGSLQNFGELLVFNQVEKLVAIVKLFLVAAITRRLHGRGDNARDELMQFLARASNARVRLVIN